MDKTVHSPLFSLIFMLSLYARRESRKNGPGRQRKNERHDGVHAPVFGARFFFCVRYKVEAVNSLRVDGAYQQDKSLSSG